MKMDTTTKAKICIAMRECTPIEMQIGNVTILVDEGGGPWGQAMICGAVVNRGYSMTRKWCRTLEELEEFLEWF